MREKGALVPKVTANKDYKYTDDHNEDIAQLLSSITPEPHKGRMALSAFGNTKQFSYL